MNTAAPSVVSNNSLDLPIARLDSEDEQFIRPVREFLETNGCVVVFQRNPAVAPTYHIVCGSSHFVKQFISESYNNEEKRLVMLFDESEHHANELAKLFRAKIAIVPTAILSSRQTNVVFEFFFTSSETVFDVRKTENIIEQSSLPKPEEVFSEDLTVLTNNDTKRIAETMASVFGSRSGEKDDGNIPQHVKRTSRRSNKKHHGVVARLLILSLVLLLPVFWYAIGITLSSVSIAVSAKRINQGEIRNIALLTSIASFGTMQSRIVLTVIEAPLALVGQQGLVRGQERVISFLVDVTQSVRGMADIIKQGKEVATLILVPSDGSATSPAVAVDRLREQLLLEQNTLGLAQAQLRFLRASHTFPFSLSSVVVLVDQGDRALTKAYRGVTDLITILRLYPEFAGFREKKTYLVLLQNSMELRPTGGFIGSIATATLTDGTLLDFHIQDVYTVDGQLKGHVDPPGPIRDLLGQEHWYLRDSNWDADFSQSAQRARWFYEKETGVMVDGVIAISTPLLTDLLAATGPLELPDYTDRISTDNFYGKSIFYTQTDFFPGSTQKKDFLGSLMAALVAKMTSAKGVPASMLFTAISTALARGDILLWFGDWQQQALVERSGWAGAFPVTTFCSNQQELPCVADALAITEANLGVNKINYFIKRNVRVSTVIAEEGSIDHAVTVGLHNTATSEQFNGGTYRTYVRFSLPPGASVKSISIDSAPVGEKSTKKNPLVLLPYTETEFGQNNTTVGVALDVAPVSEKQVTIEYRLVDVLRVGQKPVTYEFILRKQPGITNTSLETSVHYPVFWTAVERDSSRVAGAVPLTAGAARFLAKGNVLEYNTDLSRSYSLAIEFTK